MLKTCSIVECRTGYKRKKNEAELNIHTTMYSVIGFPDVTEKKNCMIDGSNL